MLPKDFEEIVGGKQFNRTLQGYNPKQVDHCFNSLISHYKDIYEQKNALEKTIINFRKKEKYLNSAIIRAEQSTDKLKQSAELEAECIIKQAEQEAEQIRREALIDARRVRTQAIYEGQAFVEQHKNNHNLYKENTKNLIESLYYSTRCKINSLQEELLDQLEKYSKIMEQSIDNNHEIEQMKGKKDVDWKEREANLLVGKIVNKDILDKEGNVVASKSTIVTPELLKLLVEKEIYGELFSAIGDEEVNEYVK
jgi:cell division septum initiation protein DivIVA